jgi:hypothetical protein
MEKYVDNTCTYKQTAVKSNAATESLAEVLVKQYSIQATIIIGFMWYKVFYMAIRQL